MRKNFIVVLLLLIIISFVGCNINIEPSVLSSRGEGGSESTSELINDKSQNSKSESGTESKDTSNTVTSGSISKTDIYFDNSYAFLGNSIIGDLKDYEVVDDADVYADIGLNVASVFDAKLKGHKKTILNELFDKNYKTIFIMFGTNELGWSYPEVFVDDYKELIDEIKAKLPNVKINLISLTPITKTQEKKSDDGVNNKNISKYNHLIKDIAKEKNVTFLDVNSYLKDENGYLPEKDSPDGTHLQPDCSLRFVNILKYLIAE